MKNFFILFIIFILSSSIVFGVDTWNAKIEDCIPDGSIDCDQKLLINLTVIYDSSGNIKEILVPYADFDGVNQTFDFPVEIRINQSQPNVSYPLSYVHDVPYIPYEEVIKVQNTFPGVQECVDSPSASDPTCGWIYQGNETIPDSQGFCCNKDLSEITDTTWWRGETLLGEQSTIINSFSTGHCYRSEELTYSGLDIETPESVPTVEVQITVGTKSETFTFDPDSLLFEPSVPDSINMHAEMIKEYDIPDFSNKMLYYPVAPGNHTYVQNLQNYTMILSKEEVTVNGSECDKVGVSYELFRQQKAFCSVTRAGDCLLNQLYHKYSIDQSILQIDPNAKTTYLISNLFGDEGSLDLIRNDSNYLEYFTPELNKAVLLFEIDLDELYEKINLSIKLVENWNLISIPTTPINNSVEAIMKGCDWNKIWRFNPDQSWTSTATGLETMDSVHGYWVDRIGLVGNCTITIEGDAPVCI